MVESDKKLGCLEVTSQIHRPHFWWASQVQCPTFFQKDVVIMVIIYHPGNGSHLKSSDSQPPVCKQKTIRHQRQRNNETWSHPVCLTFVNVCLFLFELITIIITLGLRLCPLNQITFINPNTALSFFIHPNSTPCLASDSSTVILHLTFTFIYPDLISVCLSTFLFPMCVSLSLSICLSLWFCITYLLKL